MRLLLYPVTAALVAACSCPIFCSDQTRTQDQYTEARDECRKMSELKVDMALKNSDLPPDDKSRKTQLITLFADCMATKNWAVPMPEAPKPAAAASAAGAPKAETPHAAAPAVAAETTSSESRRSAECAFARHSRNQSSISADRASACDLECNQRLAANKSNKKPAACP